jgi:nickel-dependent lactate racemase
VLEADVRVCLGALEYHYFVGYSGGYKAIIPGASGLDTIKANHRMMTAPGAVPGKWDGNPAREDIDEAGKMVGADFILNVVLDGSKRVASVVAGHPVIAHREGCARLDAFGRVTVEQPVDVVVVSAGGYPKDINLYQAQKALDSARHIVRPGGIILLVADCGEGMGNPTFEEWMTAASGPDEMIARIQKEFVLGGHKAAAVAMAMKQAEIYLISAMPDEFARSIGFHPFDTLKQALGHALARAGGRATVAVIPDGGSLLAAVAERTPGHETHHPVT